VTDEIRCPVCCRRPPGEGLTICPQCLGRIDGDLERIVELTRLAADWHQGRRSAQEPTSRPVASSRPPLDIAALDGALGLAGGIVDPAPSVEDDKRTGGSGRPAWMRTPAPNVKDGLVQTAPIVLGCLESWVRLTREEAGLSPWGVATEGHEVTTPSLVAFLRAWLAWIAERPDYPIEDLASEVKGLRWQLEALDPDRDKPGPRIPCNGDHPDQDGRTCGYRLVVTMERPADDVTCPRCGSTTTAGRILLGALNDPGVTVWAYPADITDALGIAPTTLRQWSSRGHIRRLGSRYDVGACFRRHVGG
jgi:hypothetical protein